MYFSKSKKLILVHIFFAHSKSTFLLYNLNFSRQLSNLLIENLHIVNKNFVEINDFTDDFDGLFLSLSNIPAGLSDGDDNTQLSEAAVDGFVANNGYLTSYTETDPIFAASAAKEITSPLLFMHSP